MASLKRNEKKNGEVVYRINLFLGNDKTGKRMSKVITYKVDQSATPKQQEKEALKYALEYEDKIKNGESYEGEEMSFEEYSVKWLEDKKGELAYSTYENYTHIVNAKIVPYFHSYKVAKIKPPHIEAFYKTLIGQYSNGTIKKIARVLSGMFKTAFRWQMIQVNPCTNAKIPRDQDEETELKYFTPEQSLMFQKSLDMTFETVIRGHTRIDDTGKPYCVADYVESHSIPLQLKVFFTLSLYCGFRKGETLALCWHDINFEKNEIKISKSAGKCETGTTIKKPKTKTSCRTVSFPEEIKPLLKQYKSYYNQYRFQLGSAWQGNDNLFIQDDGKLMGRSTPYQSFKRHLKRYNKWVFENEEEAARLGLETLPLIPLHGLRHSCATLLNYLEINIIDISKILGHAKSSTTMDIYAHSFDKQTQAVANKLDDFLKKNREIKAIG